MPQSPQSSRRERQPEAGQRLSPSGADFPATTPATTELLGLPLAFSQAVLLSPEEFAKKANERGIRLTVDDLVDLHRRRILIPFFQIFHTPGVRPPIAVAPSSQHGYGNFRTPFALVTDAAQDGRLIDPAGERFRPWKQGLRLPIGGGHRSHYPAAFYSEHQLLATKEIETLTGWFNRHAPVANRQAKWWVSQLSAAIGQKRRLAVLLAALDMQYLPQIMRVVRHANAWEEEIGSFVVSDRLGLFKASSEDLAEVATKMLISAGSSDPLGRWYDLVRRASPSSWSTLKGAASSAMDTRVAAEILLLAAEDGGGAATKPPSRDSRRVWHPLDDRVTERDVPLDRLLADRGLSPHPAVLLVLEGETETLLMPRVLERLYGGPVPPELVQVENMKSIDRDLDLLVRHVATPRVERTDNDVVILGRPPTRILIAVDAEKKFETDQMRRDRRDGLVRRVHESLPMQLRTTNSHREIASLIDVETWGRSATWEFANFSDRELATAVERVAGCQNASRWDLVAAIRQERADARRPNIETAAKKLSIQVRKIDLAEALWTTLRRKIDRIPKTTRSSRVPAIRIAVRALETAVFRSRASLLDF